jgi:CheY-like chemotaxis protein
MKKRVLIIDDDVQLNKINEKILVSSGLINELHISKNGKEGLDYLKTRAEKNYPLPHIIILDLDMPVLNGLGFIDAFQALTIPGKGNIELVVFTSSSSSKDRQKAIDKGIKHYIEKPYLLRPLRDIISRMHVADTDRFDNRKAFGLEKTIL